MCVYDGHKSTYIGNEEASRKMNEKLRVGILGDNSGQRPFGREDIRGGSGRTMENVDSHAGSSEEDKSYECK